MTPPCPRKRWVRLYCPSMSEIEGGWKSIIASFVYALHKKRGMRGSLIHCPRVTYDSAVTTRIFRLTDPSDYDIVLENMVAEPFFDDHGTVIRTGSITITPWSPGLVHFDPQYRQESLRRMARWRYQVMQTMTQPASRAQQFLYLLHNDGPADRERGLAAWIDIFKGLHRDVCLPIRFPKNFLPVGIASFTQEKGWVSTIRSCQPRHCEGFYARIIWECETIPGRFSGWSVCDPPLMEELIPSLSYEQSNTTTQCTFIIGWVNGLCRRFVEVYPGDVIDNDPIGAFQIHPSNITDCRDLAY